MKKKVTDLDMKRDGADNFISSQSKVCSADANLVSTQD